MDYTCVVRASYCRDLFSLGSMVQNGKFSAGAEALVNTLKKVDFLIRKECCNI